MDLNRLAALALLSLASASAMAADAAERKFIRKGMGWALRAVAVVVCGSDSIIG